MRAKEMATTVCSLASSATACTASAAATTGAWSRHTWTTGKKLHDIVHTMYSQNIET